MSFRSRGNCVIALAKPLFPRETTMTKTARKQTVTKREPSRRKAKKGAKSSDAGQVLNGAPGDVATPPEAAAVPTDATPVATEPPPPPEAEPDTSETRHAGTAPPFDLFWTG